MADDPDPTPTPPGARVGPSAEIGPQVFVEDLERLQLRPEDRHHLERALRLRPGDELVCADGQGSWRRARLGVEVEPTSPVRTQPRPTPPLTVGFALVKGSRPELIVAKLTELGVDRIVVVAAARSVVRWDGDRATAHLARLSRVARESAMQSRRAYLPEVTGPRPVAQLVADPEIGPGLALAAPGGDPPSLARPSVLVGPEGGWTDEELAMAAVHVGLGPQILRVETAAITVGALTVALRSGLVEPSGPLVVREHLPRV